MTEPANLSAASGRLSRTLALQSDISRLKYVSGKREEALRRLGLQTVGDLLVHIPHRYLDFSHSYYIEYAPVGQTCTVVATVDRITVKNTPRMQVTEVCCVDETGVIKAVFFKQPWVARQLNQGDVLALHGKVEFNYGFKQMASPHYEKIDAGDTVGQILPVHYASEGASPAWVRRIVSGALETIACIADPLPARLRARRKLMSETQALRALHFPSSMGEREFSRRRLAYEEVLFLQLALRLRNDTNLLGVPAVQHRPGAHVDALYRALPFTLSDEQQVAVGEILAGMSAPSVMNRLLLGDVGTGKTAVATFAMAAAADTSSQACMMAPTTVLAQQYQAKCGPLLKAAGVRSALLISATPQSERTKITAALARGDIDVLFGTNALLSEDVEFNNLSVVIIDEQHRFGVNQRNALRAKGPGADLLVMTATPIPRTLALSVYGDLETSIIRKRPVVGAGVSTKVLTDPNRDIAYDAVYKALQQKQQVYVICPLVAPQQGLDELEDVPGAARDDDGSLKIPVPLHDCQTETERLRVQFPNARIGVLTGRMKPDEKDAAIEAFRRGEVDILVSTTVVEVGVDVPNATVMIIENGERFGLATLHQLRGRVGRGGISGQCFVMTHSSGKGRRSKSMERLEALEATSDGFELAEMDLRLRHEGEILGLRQSGGVSLRFVDLDSDTDLIENAHADAIEMLRYSPDLGAGAVQPMRHEVVRRFGDVFKEVSGG